MLAFEDGDDECKVKVLLGMPSGSKLEDAKVDRAVKCFLLKVERGRNNRCRLRLAQAGPRTQMERKRCFAEHLVLEFTACPS